MDERKKENEIPSPQAQITSTDSEMPQMKPKEKTTGQGKRNLQSVFTALLAVLVPAAMVFLLVAVTQKILG